MKHDLSVNIDNSARELRNANQAAASVQSDIDSKAREISELRDELNEADNEMRSLYTKRCEAEQKRSLAEQRYAFYCKEAVEHPF